MINSSSHFADQVQQRVAEQIENEQAEQYRTDAALLPAPAPMTPAGRGRVRQSGPGNSDRLANVTMAERDVRASVTERK